MTHGFLTMGPLGGALSDRYGARGIATIGIYVDPRWPKNRGQRDENNGTVYSDNRDGHSRSCVHHTHIFLS